MAKQVWGTFSVRDHTRRGAFVSEVLLYDRLVLPVPPDEAERKRWSGQGWDPARLDVLLNILRDRAVTVPWDSYQQQAWRTRYEAGKRVAEQTPDYAFGVSRTQLTQGLPSHVTGVQAVPSYADLNQATVELGLRAASPNQLYPGGAAVSIIAHEFLVPDDSEDRSDEALRAAVDIASDATYGRKRTAFWRWLREYLDDSNMCHAAAIQDAVEEMDALLEEQREIVRKARVKTVSKYAFAIGASAISVAAGGPAAIALAGSFISFGCFLADQLKAEPDQPREVVLLHDVQRHFGWRRAV